MSANAASSMAWMSVRGKVGLMSACKLFEMTAFDHHAADNSVTRSTRFTSLASALQFTAAFTCAISEVPLAIEYATSFTLRFLDTIAVNQACMHVPNLYQHTTQPRHLLHQLLVTCFTEYGTTEI